MPLVKFNTKLSLKQGYESNKDCTIDSYSGFIYGVECHFQQYFSYIMARSVLLVEKTVVPGENH